MRQRSEPVTACPKMEGNASLLSLLAVITVLVLTILGAIFTATLFLSYLITREDANQGQQVVPLHIHRHHRQSEEDWRRGGRGRRN